MFPTMADVFENARAKAGDRVTGGGQIWNNTRLRPFVSEAIAKLMSVLTKAQVPLGQVESHIAVPPNQGYLDPRAYGISNIGRLVAVHARQAEEVPGGPFHVSAAEVYGAEPYGAPLAGFNDDVTGTGIEDDGAIDPPFGTQVIVKSTQAHELEDGATVVLSPPIVPAYSLNSNQLVNQVCGEWAVSAYADQFFGLTGCRTETQFNQLEVLVSQSSNEFIKLDITDHLDVQPTNIVPSMIEQVEWANNVLRWRPVSGILQLRLLYQVSSAIPELLTQRIAVDECEHILGNLAAGYALLTTPDKDSGLILIQRTLGPNGGVPLGGDLGEYKNAKVRELQNGRRYYPRPYRPRTHNITRNW